MCIRDRLLIIHLDELARPVQGFAVARGDQHDRIAEEVGFLPDGNQHILVLFEVPDLSLTGQPGGGDDQLHAGQRLRRVGIDREDLRAWEL